MKRFAVFVAVAVALAGCGTGSGSGEVTSADVTEKPSNASASNPATAAVWPSDVAIHRNAAGEVECPIMKDAVKSPDGKKFQDYNGKRYYFCCDGCPEAFAKDPAQYAEKKDEKVKPTDG